MGPTSSGKTHTMFGNFTEPGLVPRALKKLLAPDKGNDFRTSRSYFISMFEICSERGRGEKILDLFQCGAELSMQQSNIKGLQEVAISCVDEAESLLTQGMSIRSTAATNANSQSSRSQCIINVRSSPKMGDGQRNECKLGEAVLIIADLAGAEREKKTGNQGVRLNESNFINNTSMVFGLCLRALLEHQKNPKRAMEKHYKSSFLTKYLKDFLEGNHRMAMVLNVSPGEENYIDTSFVLRQASPYVNIKFTTPSEELPILPRPKRASSILCKELQPRRKKFRLSQEHLPFKHGTGQFFRQSLVRRTIEDKVNVGGSIAFCKDRNFSGSLSSVHAPVQGAEHTHIRKSSSVLIFAEEQLKEKISKMEGKINVGDSIGEEQTHVKGPSSFLTFTEEELKERMPAIKDNVIVEDFIAVVKDKNSSCSLPSVYALGQNEEQSHIRDSSVLSFTEEQLKERISFEVEEQVKERHERLMEVYEMALSNVLKDHQTKVKMMEKHGEELELELKKEREHSLELSTEVAMLKERCACLDCENEKLQMVLKSGNIIMYTESDYENSKKLLIPQDVCCQNDVNAKSVIRSDCNNNALSVVECKVEAISGSCQACSTVGEEEQSCTGSDNNETGETNCKTSLAAHNKSGCLSGDDLGAFQSVTLHEESISQPCEDEVYLPGTGLLDYKQVTISKCEETISSPVFAACQNRNNLAHKRDDMIAKDNSLLAWTNACKSRTEEQQSCVSGQTDRCLKEDSDNLLETNVKDDMDTISVITSLEDQSIDPVEDAEVGTSQNRNVIEICESVTEEDCCTHREVTGVPKEDVENLPRTNEKENIDTVLGTNTLEAFSVVPSEGAEISTSQNIKEIEACEDCNCLSGAKSNLKRGRMLASLLLNRKVDDGMGDTNRNAIEVLEETKATSESYTTSEDDVGPIGQCLEELLGLSLSEIENGLWKGDIECKCKMSDVLERNGGILDLHSFTKGYSQQRSLCLRYCFSLICNMISNDKQRVTLPEDVNPKSRQTIFRTIVKAQTVGKAASYARWGLQQEGLFKNTNNCCPSPDSLECNKENLCSSTKSPRRKLLPAPSMLVKGIDEGTVEDEIPKVVDRSFRKNSSAERAVGTRGRMSLARLLA
ncbi:hypothetical protein KI387_036167, partial [Taxus chinensis]